MSTPRDDLVPEGEAGNATRPRPECPVEVALAAVSGRWTTLILRDLSRASRTYGELASGLPTLSDKVLADRLRALTAAGFVRRDVAATYPRTTRYTLTAKGEQLRPLLVELYATGRRLQQADESRAS